MGTDNRELLKERLEEQEARKAEKLHDIIYNSAVLRALDVVALEAMKLEIPKWESMTVAKLRNEIKKRHDAAKASR